MLHLPSNSHFEVTFDNFDFAVYDCATGMLEYVDSHAQKRVLEERYEFIPGRGGCLSFTATSDIRHLALIEAVVSDAVKHLPLDHADVGISVSEIVHNAMKVAEERSEHKDIQIGLLYVPGIGMFLSISDQLGRLNLDALPDSFLDESGNVSLETHGRGLMIVGELMEMVAYNPCESGDGFKEILLQIPMRKEQSKGGVHADDETVA